MNNTEHNSNLIAIARGLVLQSDSASYQRGIIEMLANYLEVDYTEAVDLIDDAQSTENDHMIESIIEITRKLLGTTNPFGKADSNYRRALRDVIMEVMDTDYRTASSVLFENHGGSGEPITNEHIILVAFHTSGQNDMESAQRRLMEHLPRPEDKDNDIEAWWIAMDERYEGSDNDSAEFVPGSGRAAVIRYRERQNETVARLTPR